MCARACACVLVRVCVCEKESVWGSINDGVVLFPIEQTWRSKQDKHGRVITQ